MEPFKAKLDPIQREALDSLRKLEKPELKTTFQRCKPPAMESLVGEFDAELLHQGGPLAGLVTKVVFGTSGNWIGKAFSPISADTGVGYNCFQSGFRSRIEVAHGYSCCPVDNGARQVTGLSAIRAEILG